MTILPIHVPAGFDLQIKKCFGISLQSVYSSHATDPHEYPQGDIAQPVTFSYIGCIEVLTETDQFHKSA